MHKEDFSDYDWWDRVDFYNNLAIIMLETECKYLQWYYDVVKKYINAWYFNFELTMKTYSSCKRLRWLDKSDFMKCC